MGWYCYSKCRCKECGHEFVRSIDTLSMCNPNFHKCPKCLGEWERIDNATVQDYINERKNGGM